MTKVNLEKRAALTAERLRELLDYNPETGIFTWRQRPGNTRGDKVFNSQFAGKPAGTLHHTGYINIRIDDREYTAHHLVRLWVRGKWPETGYEVDHINLDKADNRFANLRHVTPSQNRTNRQRYSSNTSGKKGACFHKRLGKWQSRITHNGTHHHLGYFDSPESAHAAYSAAAAELHGRFARTE
jgi:HNH endonuclease/AP2 domain